MHFRERTPEAAVRGHVAVWRRDEVTGLILPHHQQRNQIQLEWGFVAAKQIGSRNANYNVAGMYIEYANVADPEDTVTVPSFDDTAGLEYYLGLSGSSDRDYLRVPLLQDPLLGIAPGYESYFIAGQSGNSLTFFGLTSGVAGVNGKEFSGDVNSTAYGVALVATPVLADNTQDAIFARTYFAADEQVMKAASQQIGVTWTIEFLI